MLPIARFNAFAQQNQLFKAGDVLLAAVSGGMDSVLLVHLLKAAGYNFAIAHCNFQLRGAEADADQQFCRQLASQMQVAFYTVSFNTAAYAQEHKLSIQMAARQLRYQWFEQVRQQHQYTAIALAHHQNDAIETILLNLTRGTGIAGLHGILPKNNYLVRPLLFLTRQEIASIVAQSQLAYVEDSSNSSTKYARNKLRHEVVPVLKELNPNLENTFERNLAHFRELEKMFRQQVALAKKEVWNEQGADVHLPLNKLRNLHPQRLLFLGLFKDYGFNDTAIDDLISALGKHSGRVFESAGYRLLLDRDKVILTPKAKVGVLPVSVFETDSMVKYGEHYSFTIKCSEMPVHMEHNADVALVNHHLLIYPLTLRTWQQGDYFVPLGMETRKKVSDYFVNKKVPLHQKTQIPILVNGNGDIIWIAGYRLDNRYKLTDQTKKVTIFELLRS
jgi:tRNA(Ile)-lysidine synthase